MPSCERSFTPRLQILYNKDQDEHSRMLCLDTDVEVAPTNVPAIRQQGAAPSLTPHEMSRTSQFCFRAQ